MFFQNRTAVCGERQGEMSKNRRVKKMVKKNRQHAQKEFLEIERGIWLLLKIAEQIKKQAREIKSITGEIRKQVRGLRN